MAPKKCKGTELSVFKGKEAKLNRAIFQVLAAKGGKTVYDIHKQIRLGKKLKGTHYANVNKRVKALEQANYLKKVDQQTTKAGFQTTIYDISPKAYVALALNALNIEDLLDALEEDWANEILAFLAKLTKK